jgi:hypothetical protein
MCPSVFEDCVDFLFLLLGFFEFSNLRCIYVVEYWWWVVSSW